MMPIRRFCLQPFRNCSMEHKVELHIRFIKHMPRSVV